VTRTSAVDGSPVDCQAQQSLSEHDVCDSARGSDAGSSVTDDDDSCQSSVDADDDHHVCDLVFLLAGVIRRTVL